MAIGHVRNGRVEGSFPFSRMLAVWLVSVLAFSMLAFAILAAKPVAAHAEENYLFCAELEMPIDGTCPPNGSAQYAHLELVKGDANGGSHETCVDAYIDEGSGYYTEQKCMYSAGEEATVWPGGKWGYPRAWNGGKVAHAVFARQYP